MQPTITVTPPAPSSTSARPPSPAPAAPPSVAAPRPRFRGRLRAALGGAGHAGAPARKAPPPAVAAAPALHAPRPSPPVSVPGHRVGANSRWSEVQAAVRQARAGQANPEWLPPAPPVQRTTESFSQQMHVFRRASGMGDVDPTTTTDTEKWARRAGARLAHLWRGARSSFGRPARPDARAPATEPVPPAR